MYKLKDIIKSGGGNAKINRFINKYILSKDEKKDVIQEIKNSKDGSSDGGGVKEYYYKCIESLDNVMRENILLWINNIEVILYYQEALVKCSNILLVVDGVNIAIGFKFLDTPTKALIPINNNENLISIEFNGNLNDRAIDYCTKLGYTQEQIENVLSSLNNFLKEITKEEYESLI